MPTGPHKVLVIPGFRDPLSRGPPAAPYDMILGQIFDLGPGPVDPDICVSVDPGALELCALGPKSDGIL